MQLYRLFGEDGIKYKIVPNNHHRFDIYWSKEYIIEFLSENQYLMMNHSMVLF